MPRNAPSPRHRAIGRAILNLLEACREFQRLPVKPSQSPSDQIPNKLTVTPGVIFAYFRGTEPKARRARVACEGRISFLALLPSHATCARPSVHQKFCRLIYFWQSDWLLNLTTVFPESRK